MEWLFGNMEYMLEFVLSVTRPKFSPFGTFVVLMNLGPLKVFNGFSDPRT